jgi:hypothetical protein
MLQSFFYSFCTLLFACVIIAALCALSSLLLRFVSFVCRKLGVK